MKTKHRRPDSYGVVTTLVIALSVWLVHMSGLLQNSDDRLSDLVNAFSARSFNRSNVLLVYAPEAILQSDDQRLADLVKSINELQPAKVGIAHSLSDAQRQRLRSLPCAPNIVVGHLRQEAADALASESEMPRVDETIQSGFLDLYLDGQPIYRKHVGNYGTSLNPEWSFEAAIVNQVARSSDSIPDGVLRVRFESGVNGMPHVQAEDFASDRVIAELVRDRIVLIGRADRGEVGFVTPTTVGRERMSTLELRGNFLQSLRNGNHITNLSSLQVLLVIGLIAFVVIQWVRNVLNRWVRRTCIVVSMLACVVAWLGLSIWSVQLPVTAILLTTWSAFAAVLYARFQALRQLVDDWRLLRSTSDRLSTKPPEEDAWAALAVSVNQIFFPRRMALLELPPGATHLRIVNMHDCDCDDVVEKRRDINRTPYRTAIETGYPVRGEDRRFFGNDAGDKSIEFIVPLIMVSEVIGFMVIEMDQATIDQWGDFEETLSHYAAEMALFLANSRPGGVKEDPAKDLIHRTRVLPEQLMSVSMFKEEIEHRRVEKMLSETLDSVETSLAVCDIFGRLVKANSKMLTLLQHEELPVEDINCVDILVALTDNELSECRKIFRRCIVEEHAEQIVLPSKSDDEPSSVLFVKPLCQSELDENGGIETRFVAIEILSGSAFEKINHWQRQFLSSYSDRTQKQLDQLERIAETFDANDPSEKPTVDSFKQLADDVLRVAMEARSAVDVDLALSTDQCFLLDSIPLLNSALQQSLQIREAQGIKLSSTVPDKLSDVLGNPFGLERTFAAVVDCMVHECDDQTKLVIDVRESEDQVTFQFSTRPETLMDGLDFPSMASSNEDADIGLKTAQDMLLSRTQLDCLNDSKQWLHAWGGDINIECDAYFRVAISVTLRTTTQEQSLIGSGSNELGDSHV